MKKHLVVVSNLYPNINEPNRGIFIKHLTENLTDKYQVTVVSPVPWRPRIINRLRGVNSIPDQKIVNGIQVYYPRHIVIPKILRSTYGWFMSLTLGRILRKINSKKAIDIISAHWVYPDGYGAVKAAKNMRIPITVHALGCDINEYSKYTNRRKRIIEALKGCDRVVVKSQDLAIKVASLIGGNHKTHTIMNGVDNKKFKVLDIAQSKKDLGLDLDEDFLLFIGNIQEEKGLIYLLEAFSRLKEKNIKLVVIGDGPQKKEMEDFVSSFDLEKNIRFIGARPHDEIPLFLNAANGLCLPSLREGCPNIVLEALSCGTPVLASRVGAVPQIIKEKHQGVVVDPMSIEEILYSLPEFVKLKGSEHLEFEWPTWQDNADQISAVFQKILN